MLYSTSQPSRCEPSGGSLVSSGGKCWFLQCTCHAALHFFFFSHGGVKLASLLLQALLGLAGAEMPLPLQRLRPWPGRGVVPKFKFKFYKAAQASYVQVSVGWGPGPGDGKRLGTRTAESSIAKAFEFFKFQVHLVKLTAVITAAVRRLTVTTGATVTSPRWLGCRWEHPSCLRDSD